MFSVKLLFIFGLTATINLSAARPDSAGVVEMVNGLAYGGIPYGSVSGMVAKYPGYRAQPQVGGPLEGHQFANFNPVRPIIITPNFRATRLAGSQPRAVQIYNLRSVIAPGVVGSISQIGY